MTPIEAKLVLQYHRPYKPHKTEGRRLQRAIDVATDIIDEYIQLKKLIDEADIKLKE